MTVLAGDWLYMQSFAVALGERKLEVLDSLIQITQRMVEGELLQLTYLGRPEISETELLDLIERKTAYLFSGCTSIPAIAAGAKDDAVKSLESIGMNMGMAFQLVDDLLDLTSTQQLAGKPVVSDLREGKVTLPVSFVIRDGSEEDVAKVRTVLNERGFRSVDSSEILRMVEKVDGVGRTRRMAQDYSDRALAALQEFPQSVYREAIAAIPAFILGRIS
jgi:octaprenyl-diphosphate synthase